MCPLDIPPNVQAAIPMEKPLEENKIPQMQSQTPQKRPTKSHKFQTKHPGTDKTPTNSNPNPLEETKIPQIPNQTSWNRQKSHKFKKSEDSKWVLGSLKVFSEHFPLHCCFILSCRRIWGRDGKVENPRKTRGWVNGMRIYGHRFGMGESHQGFKPKKNKKIPEFPFLWPEFLGGICPSFQGKIPEGSSASPYPGDGGGEREHPEFGEVAKNNGKRDKIIGKSRRGLSQSRGQQGERGGSSSVPGAGSWPWLWAKTGKKILPQDCGLRSSEWPKLGLFSCFLAKAAGA